MSDSSDVQADRSVRPGDRVFHGLVAGVLVAVSVGSLWPADVASMPSTFSVPSKDGHTICMLRRMTGMPCPTCGVTRSFRAMGNGAWAEAVGFHPLGPLYAAMLLVVLVRSAGVAVGGREWLNGVARVLVWMLPFVGLATVLVYVVQMTWFFGDGTGTAAWQASPLAQLWQAVSG